MPLGNEVTIPTYCNRAAYIDVLDNELKLDVKCSLGIKGNSCKSFWKGKGAEPALASVSILSCMTPSPFSG